MGCIFCAIVKKEAPAAKVYEDDKMLIIMDKKPITHGHMLVIPKRHSELLTEMNDDTIGEMFKLAKKAALALKKSKLNCKAINYFLADGAEAGQEVFHVHLHIIPRYKGDGFYMHMPKEYDDETSTESLQKIAAKISIPEE